MAAQSAKPKYAIERRVARRRRAIKRQLRRAGIPIPAAILLDTRALRALRASSAQRRA